MTFRRVGRDGLLVEVTDTRTAQRVFAMVQAVVDRGELPAPDDVVPAARTVLLDGVDRRRWQERLTAWPSAPAGEVAAPERDSPGEIVRIPVAYDGPDLSEVALAWGCRPDEVAARHGAQTYTVAFCGFAPGFAYCVADGGAGSALPSVPRRDDPRTKVPAGAVGFAGEYCGVYPNEMPGGWQLVGTTDAVMFDPSRDRAALLRPGNRVRFETT